MSKGRTYQDPQFRYEDSHSGREILRLTDYLGHSNHFYFTDPCWIPGTGNRSFVFTSDRENTSNLFRGAGRRTLICFSLRAAANDDRTARCGASGFCDGALQGSADVVRVPG